jgi:hypothetical protein
LPSGGFLLFEQDYTDFSISRLILLIGQSFNRVRNGE